MNSSKAFHEGTNYQLDPSVKAELQWREERGHRHDPSRRIEAVNVDQKVEFSKVESEADRLCQGGQTMPEREGCC